MDNDSVANPKDSHHTMTPQNSNSSWLSPGAQSDGEIINGSLLAPLHPMPSHMSIVEATLFSTCMALCICMTLVGNILVVISVFTYKPLRNVANFFIVSLAVADIGVSILVMPFNTAKFIIGYWVFGEVLCNMWLTFDILICTASIFNLCAIALDRYYAIHDPLNYARRRTMKHVLVCIALVWGTSAVISIPPLFGWKSDNALYDSKTKSCDLTDEKGFVIYSALGSFFIPLFIMTFVYAKIFQATRRRLRERAKAASAARLAAISMTNNAQSNKVTTVAVSVPVNQETSSTESPDEGHEGGRKNNAKSTSKKTSPSAKNHDKPNNNSNCCGNVQACKDEASKKLVPATSPTPSSRKPSDCDSPLNKNSKNGSQRTKTFQVREFLEERQRISLSRERRAARTMGIIMGCFVLCWLPFFLMYVIFPFCATCSQTDPRIVNAIVWLGYINSSLNPIIYTVFNIDFRRAFKRILQGHCRHR